MRTRDYIFKRSNSRYWQLRLRFPQGGYFVYPDGRSKTFGAPTSVSLSTGCETEADAIEFSAPYILQLLHIKARKKLVRRLPKPGMVDGRSALIDEYERRLAAGFRHVNGPEMKPGERGDSMDDGSYWKCSTDGQTVVLFDSDDNVLESRPNWDVHRLDYIGQQREHVEIREMEARVKAIGRMPREATNRMIIDHWVKTTPTHRKKPKSTNTIRELKTFYEKLKREIPDISLVSITFQEAKAAVAAIGGSTSSLRKEVGLMKSVITLAVAARKAGRQDFPVFRENIWGQDNLIPGGISGKRKSPVMLNNFDLERIFDDLSSWGWQERLFFSFCYFMGCRADEPFQINGWEYYGDSDTPCIRYGEKDSNRPYRLVPIAPQVLAVLNEIEIGGLDRLNEGIFVNKGNWVNHLMKRRLNKLGMPPHSGKTAQSLRHRFCTVAEQRGGKPAIVATIVGHVFDDLSNNEGKPNRDQRAGRSIRFRYMNGFSPDELLEVMALAAPIRIKQ